ncbi:interferon-inducible GTPase 5-like [Erpetoichthys calabaricus]|uniref:interferon-inducible GTPase 5-like n=1 Tax=Erpetoichthys calabaricus TaxID=27687 RepID=UPI002234C527|nr:interferon-inducible GTPase 5-like [Erpetoichthys calabaricus]
MGNTKSTYYGFFKENEAEELGSLYSEMGFEAVVSKIKEKNEALEKETLSIAVTGESGTGKSALVNAMRGLNPGEPGAAEEGTTEQTMKVTRYKHPKLETVCFYDLPGIGTLNFPARDYAKMVNLNTYDLFIIVIGNRFLEHDALLIREIQKMKKQFYFVRSKIDFEFNNLKHQNRENDWQKEFDKIRDDCIRNLNKSGFSSQEVFLVSSRFIKDFDFPRFCDILESQLSENKRYIFQLSLPNFSADVVRKKKAILHRKILAAAAASFVAGASPIPGVSIACDIAILVKTFLEIRKSFGLDDDSLGSLALKVGKPVEVLKAEVKNPFISDITETSVIRVIAGSTAAVAVMAAEEAAHLIPIVGSVVGAPVSFLTTYGILRNSLDKFEQSAVRVIIKAFEA